MEREGLGTKRIGTGGHEEDVGLQLEGLATVGLELNGMRIDERGRGAQVDAHIVAAHVLVNASALVFLDQPFARQEVGDRGAGAELELQAMQLAMAKAREEQGGFAEGLGGERAGVGGRAAEERLFFDERHALAEIGGTGSGLFAGRTTANDHQVEFFASHDAGCFRES